MNSVLKHIAIVIIFTAISCKKEVQLGQVKEQETVVPEKTTIKSKDAIKVFHIALSEDEPQDKTEKITAITKKIQTQFEEYPFKNTSKELEETKEKHKEKSFLKILARDFKNSKFLEVSQMHYAYIVPEENKMSSPIALEQWHFKNEADATSCFESLKKYEEATIHFKTINWIWVQQANSIYLVFAHDYLVTGTEMQHIKQEIINVIKPLGAYQTVQFYE